MLQRVPRILEVTANSYGITLREGSRKPGAAGDRQRQTRQKSAQEGKPEAQR